MITKPLIALTTLIIGMILRASFKKKGSKKIVKLISYALAISLVYTGIMPILVELTGHEKEWVLGITAVITSYIIMEILFDNCEL